jgi:hypothetical protein
MRRLIALLCVPIGALLVPVSIGARPSIPIAGEVAYCDGQPIAAVDGVLHVNSSCVINFGITWLKQMKAAYLDQSSDGGATWTRNPFRCASLRQRTVSSRVSPRALRAQHRHGTWRFTAHGFRNPNEHGDILSDPFPFPIQVTCP